MQEKTIILDGFSKTYAMTGWRLGYGVMPEWLVDAVNKLMVNSNSCTATFTQRAGLAALTGPQDCVTAMMAEFTKVDARNELFTNTTELAVNPAPLMVRVIFFFMRTPSKIT